MYRIVLWATIWLASFGIGLSQTVEIESGDVFENEMICLDVSVTGFQDVLSMDFQLRWDSTVLEFSSVSAITSLIGFGDNSISDPTETSASTPSNILLVSWFDNDIMPRSLPDNDILFEVCFDAVGNLGSSSTMNLFDLEFFDGNLNPIGFEDRDGIVNVSNAAGDNLSFDFPTVSGDSGTILCVPMTVVNFDTISSFSFGVKWDATVLAFNTAQTPGNLQGFTNGNISIIGADSIYVSWQDVDNSGETLNSGEELLEICFRLVGAPARSSFLNIGNVTAAKPVSGNIADLSTNNGLVIINSPPIAPDFRISAADQDVNPGESFCVPVRVGGFENIDAFSFDISWDNSDLEYSTTADFASLNGLNAAAITTNGSPTSGISVEWMDPDGMGRDLFFNTQLFRVCFTAIGSAGNSSPFDISNASASNADGLPVEEVLNDGEINIVTPSAPDLILQLDTIELSNGDDGCLTLTVEDFTDVETLEFDVTWNNQNLIFQTASILANVPGLDASNLTTPASGGNDGELLFRWQDANNIGRVLTDGMALLEMCFQADGANFSRTFELENINVENTNPNLDKTGFGRPGRINVLPDGGGGNLTLTAGDLNLSPGGAGCLPVRVSNFVDVVTLQVEMDWDSNIFTFDRVDNLAALPGFSASSISAPTAGSLIMSWDDADLSGETLMNNSILFEICGDAVNEGTANIAFTNTEATDVSQNLLTVVTNNGEVVVSSGGGGGNNLEVYATNEMLDVGDQICMPVRVRNFEDLIVAELGVSWDANVLQFDRLQNIAGIDNLEMSSFSTPPDNGTDNLMLMSWLHESLTGQSLPDDAVLFELCYTATTPGTSPINVLNAEFADINNMLVPASLIDGSITVAGNVPGLRIDAPERTAAPGDNICLPITARDFDSLIVMEFSLTWDDAVLDFDQLQIPGNLLHLNQSSFSTPPQNMTTDRIIVSWLDNDLVGQTLPDDTELFSVCYDVIGNSGDQSVINLEDAEFADANNNTVTGFLDDGLVRVQDGTTSEFSLSTTTGNSVDQGSVECVPVRVSGFQDLTEFAFDFSWNASAFTFSSVTALANLADFDMSDITTPGGGGNAGMVSLNWMDADNSGESLTDNTVLFELCLEATGAPGVQSDLTFTNVNVTNASAGNINTNTVDGDIRINQTTIEGLQFYMTDQTVDVGDEFCIPIQVNDFEDILSMEFNLNYDPAFLRFERIENLANLPSLSAGSFSNPSSGLIILSWIDDLDLSGESLPDGDTLFTACFTALNPGMTSFVFSSEEVADAQNNLLTPTLTDSDITIEGNQPTGDLIFLIEDVSGDAGQTVCVQVSTENFNNIAGANFSVRWDEDVLNYQSVSINGSLSNFDENSILDPIESPMLGASLIVDWDNISGGASLPSPSDIFEVCFELIGDPGSQSVLAIENLTAENGNGDLVAANRNNGSVTINAEPTNDVRVTAGIESGDRDEEVCVDVTVENFTDILSAEFIMEWDPNILQFTQVTNLANLPDLSNASFGVPSQTNIPGLLSFTWFDNSLGNHSLPDGEVLFSVCFDLIGAAGSSSTLRLSELEFSTGSGTGIPSSKIDGRVDINNVETAPTVGFTISDGNVNPGEEICLPVEVNNFNDITTLELDMEWDDNILRFERVEVVAPVPDLDPSDFTDNAGLLALQWSDGSGQGTSLNDGQTIFRLCFTAIGSAGTTSQVFISDGNIENSGGMALNFAADNGLVELNDILAISEAVVDSIDCSGDMNGSIALSVTGGDGNYSYTWNPNVGGGATINGLGAGTYNVTIEDGTGAVIMRTFTLNEPPPLTINVNIMGVNPPMSNGAIDLNVTGGTPPYSIDWCCNLTDDQEEQTGLSTGIYSATITDSKGCILETGEIDLDGAIFAQVISVDSTRCHDTNDGAIEIDVSGGMPTYTIIWSDGTNVVGTGTSITGLAPGEYFYTITDSSTPQPRNLEGSVTVGSPPELVVSVDVSPETNAGNDGFIQTNVSGGTPRYTYSWFNHQNNSSSSTTDLFNLPTGYYSLAVQDANFCIARIDSIFVGPALNVPETGIQVDSISCPGECDGEITIFPEGGTGEYEYSYGGADNVPENSIDNLCSGEQIIIIEDINSGDRVVIRVILVEPEPIEVQVVTVGVSTGGDGEILLDVDGGQSPYNYEWSTGDMTKDVSGLEEGSYNVTITDDNGCVQVVEDIEVNAQTLSLDLLGVTDVDCASDLNGSIDINISGGCEPYSFTWRQNGVVISNQPNLTDVSAGFYELQVVDSCNESIFSGFIEVEALSNMVVDSRVLSDYNGFDVSGAGQMDGSATTDVTGGIGTYDYLWSNGSTEQFATGLSAGLAFVTITDALGCIVLDTIELTSPDPLNINFDILQENDCFDDRNGVATADVSGGVLPYTYVWNSGSTSATSQGLLSGFNRITVEDANGITAVDSVFIASNDPIEIDTIIRPDFGNAEGGITLVVSGGMAPYAFQWNDNANSTTSSLSGLIAGEYGVVITDAEGCSIFLNLRVPLNGDVPECLDAREVFTPNGDGKNEFFVINCIENFENDIQIFNRWGEVVFEQNDYDNFWNGRNQDGELLPQGAYFYVLTIINDMGQREVIKGHISIIR